MPSIVYIFIEGNERKRKREGEEGAPTITSNFSGVTCTNKSDPQEQEEQQEVEVTPGRIPPLQHGALSRCPTPSTGSNNNAGFDSTSKEAESHPFDSELTDTSKFGDSFNRIVVVKDDVLSYQHRATRTPVTSCSSSCRTPSEQTIIDFQHYQQKEEQIKTRKELSSDEEDSSVDEDYQVWGAGNDSEKRSHVSKDTSDTFHDLVGREEDDMLSADESSIVGSNGDHNSKHEEEDDMLSSDEEDESSIVESNGDHNSNYASTKSIRKNLKGRNKRELKKRCFDERFNQLLRFKEEFGHCNVPYTYQGNPLLGNWCRSIKQAHKKRCQLACRPKCILWQDWIERLEGIGFNWKYFIGFDDRCRELIAFKEEFGHCNIPRKYHKNASLATWCKTMRAAYNKVQKGMKTSTRLPQDRIDRLEEIGFLWTTKKSKH